MNTVTQALMIFFDSIEFGLKDDFLKCFQEFHS